MSGTCDRRELLRIAGGLLGTFCGSLAAGGEQLASERKGALVGQVEAARVGNDVLAGGGNAIDAAVAAALTAGVVAVPMCGIGGYGGHMVIALARGKVTAIDFNSTAPGAARPDMFPVDEKGNVKDQVNRVGWRAAGVPGTLAGLQLALDRHGTRSFGELVRPAIRYAREGFPIRPGFANAIRAAQAQFRQDPASARLFLDNGQPLKAGSTFRNPDLADMLQHLADSKSVAPFYRGDIARRIAAAFQKHGGLVTADDLAAYQARAVEPLQLAWGDWTIHTAPLTAGGVTVLEALAILKALGWDKRPADDPRTLHARLEALRIAWHDRLRLLGDPDQVKVPVQRLLSEAYARQMAGRVETALRDRKPVPAQSDGRSAGGTVHLSVGDAHGNLVALTLTHGENFGARVTVAGLGLLLGHGMSRFDPRPGRPNSIAPGKHPLHNMCPTIAQRRGRAVLALGGTGGRRIPNGVFEVLTQYVARGARLDDAVASPRLHTEGGLAVILEAKWPQAAADHLRKIGYTVTTGGSATCHAVERDPHSKKLTGSEREGYLGHACRAVRKKLRLCTGLAEPNR